MKPKQSSIEKAKRKLFYSNRMRSEKGKKKVLAHAKELHEKWYER